ncbi:hypothetical protein SAMN04487955_10825 [Halomonas korlensis]|uniref:Uncharacterized protein n=1 Tax=Halomonas korlensis TaxID=463301 RepID=A0A1I7ITJ4_9GAMM|nr:hypothetical protein SAMN04487955_10825 [Halomonas korlensis]
MISFAAPFLHDSLVGSRGFDEGGVNIQGFLVYSSLAFYVLLINHILYPKKHKNGVYICSTVFTFADWWAPY